MPDLYEVATNSDWRLFFFVFNAPMVSPSDQSIYGCAANGGDGGGDSFLHVTIALLMWLLTITSALIGFLLSRLGFLQASIERGLASTTTMKVKLAEVTLLPLPEEPPQSSTTDIRGKAVEGGQVMHHCASPTCEVGHDGHGVSTRGHGPRRAFCVDVDGQAGCHFGVCHQGEGLSTSPTGLSEGCAGPSTSRARPDPIHIDDVDFPFFPMDK